MTRVNVIPFKPDHLQQMTLLPDERDVILKDASFLGALADGPQDSVAFCGTAFWGDEILCVGGWYAVRPGCCQLFIIPDANMLRKHPAVFARTTIKWRQKAEDRLIYNKLIAVALPGMSDWMRVIGFEYECKLEKYNGTGRDYELWSRQL